MLQISNQSTLKRPTTNASEDAMPRNM